MSDGLNSLKKSNSSILGHIGALICVLMWGTSFVSTKALLDIVNMQPVEIFIYRFILAYILIALLKPSKLFCQNFRDEFLMLLCGILSGSIYFLAENFALRYTSTANVSLLTSTSPLLTTLIVGILYKAERPGSGLVIGSIVAMFGVACVIFNSSFSLEVNPLGDMLALAASLSWAIYSIILRKFNANYDVWFITRKTFFYGIITALPFVFLEPVQSPADILTNPVAIGNILFLGLGASLIGFMLWAETVKKVGAIKANNYMYLQSIVTLIAAAILLSEPVTLIGVLGIVLILGGLWLGDFLTRRKKASR